MHWLMLALIVAVYACIELREIYPKGSSIREGFKTWHYLLGLTIFALVWLRLLARFAGQVPPIVPRPPQWQLRVVRVFAFAIYVFVVAMPVLGWLTVSAEGKIISFFGLERGSSWNESFTISTNCWISSSVSNGNWLLHLRGERKTTPPYL